MKKSKDRTTALRIALSLASWLIGGLVLAQPGPPLTGDGLVAAVLERNPSLASIEAAEAQARVVPAGALDDPMLSYLTVPESFGSRIGDRYIDRQNSQGYAAGLTKGPPHLTADSGPGL